MRRTATWSLLALICLGTVVSGDDPSFRDPIFQPSASASREMPVPPVEVEEARTSSNPLEERLGLTPRFELRGRIEADAIIAVQSRESIAALGDLQNGYGFRRVRLGAQGTIGEVARWVSEVELAGGTVRLRDVFIGLTALPGVRGVNVGYFREPFSLEGMTSSNYITFLERSPINAFDPARNWGICGYWWPENERALYALGVFRDGTDNAGQSFGDGGNWALTGRLTGLPVYESDESDFRLVHLGSAMSFRVPKDGLVTYAVGPQSDLLTVEDSPPSPFLPSVSIPANSQQLYNLQAARVAGPFSVQGEWTGNAIQQTDASVVFLHGFYLDASYFLTSEHRGYDRTRGAFGRVHVHRPLLPGSFNRRSGVGAFEVAARFSLLDFRSSNLPPQTDGEPADSILYQLTLGLNWYLNDFTRLMVNYTGAFPDVRDKPRVTAHLFSFRAAIYW